MRLWTLHPQYLDRQGLTALWREGLLAQAVLHERTRGYRQHPQLIRFRAAPDPCAAVAAYLREVAAEAARRGYRFESAKILCDRPVAPLVEHRGQLQYEWEHLLRKLALRDPPRHASHRQIAQPLAHPLFLLVAGDVRDWERPRSSP